jgi:acyl transferase domain-containing protein/acyl carrier protein
VRLVAADISQPADVEALVRAAAQSGPALAGVVHAAGVFDDRLLVDHNWTLFRRVLAAKVSGAWNLHLATRALPLDFFVLFGSATTVICSSGLGNYVAANSFLDALAAHRRALGLPAVSIAWGPWAGVGMAEAVGSARQAQWANEGLTAIDRRQALDVFARVLGRGAAGPGPAAVAVMAVDWHRYAERHPDAARSTMFANVANFADAAMRRPEKREDAASLAQQLRAMPVPERRAALVAHISAEITNVLALPITRALDPDQGLFRMGMDSLTSMELRNRLQRDLECSLPTTLTFKYPTVRELADYLAGRLSAAHEQVARPVVAAAAVAQQPANAAEPIAIIGVGCRFPGGVASPDDFWELLRGGVDAIRELPVDRWDIDAYYDPAPGTPGKTYARQGGYLDQIDTFDPAFFGISPREAASMDPQHRLFLEVCWEALEHAGIPPTSLTGTRSAVFAGIGQDDYAQRRLRSSAVTEIDHYDGTGNLYCFAPGRLSYFLGLRGPNMAIDTACSSSLVAVQLAVQSLRNRDCDLALAGAVHLAIAPDVTLFLSQARVLSPDGRCKTFDSRADGFGRGEGCGTVVLKRLSDAVADGDRVLALIRGAAVNHDGRSSGLTVPSETAQAEVIQQALRNGGIEPSRVSYVEAHGTGTSLGDPIEVNALVGALCADRPGHSPLLIGSVKTNVGHLEAAAGMAGLIKVVLAMQHDEIPAHLHFEQPSAHIAWDQIPVKVTATRCPWQREGTPRVAGVSSFGFSGTNAHVLIEDAPEPARRLSSGRELHVLPLSARSGAALRRLAERYHRHLANHPDQDVSDLCGTASVGRSHFRHRLAIVASDAIGVLQQLDAFLTGAPADGLRSGETSANDGDQGGRSQEDLTPDQLADRFVAGVNVDWTRMYPRGSFHIADLPTYPFERERYWIDGPAARAIAPIVFEASVGITSPAYLDHHRLFGAAVYPAAAFIDRALAAGQGVFGASAFALEDIEILRPLVLPDTGTVTVRTTLTPDGAGRYSFAIQSVATDVDPVTHVSGRMAVCESSLATPTDLATALTFCEETLDVPGFYGTFAECGISFGEDFRAIRELYRRAGGSLGGIQLPAGLLEHAGTSRLHPVLLDACFQSSIASWPGGRSAAYVPVSIERVEAARSTASELWSLATPRAAHGLGSARVVDLNIVDAAGVAVAKVTGLALRASNPATLFRSTDSAARDWARWLYVPVWREASLPRRSVSEGGLRPVARQTQRWEPAGAAARGTWRCRHPDRAR